MTIPVDCVCGRHFETPEANAGRRAKCPGCGREFIVPAVTIPEDASIRWVQEPAAVSGKAVASLVLGILFFFACLTGLPAILFGLLALGDIRRSGGRLKGRGMAGAGVVLGVVGCLFTLSLVLPAVRASREAARRSQCVGNLKRIVLGLHNYHSVNGCLPPAAITDRNGKPLLSWRVALIPFINSNTLYERFHLDEPWDSPHNLSLLDSMPPAYACPSDLTRKPGMTGYQVVVGPATGFTPDFKPVTFSDITDRHDRTLLVGESRHDVPWTKPEDLPFDMAIHLNGLGSHHGYHNNGFNAAFADGSVWFLKAAVPARVLAALLTRNGNEVVEPSDY